MIRVRATSSIALLSGYATVPTVPVVPSEQRRCYREFKTPEYPEKQVFTYRALPVHHSSKWGGRGSLLRYNIGKINRHTSGPEWKADNRTIQYNIDIWTAQQTLRKRWKKRDWEIFEVPFDMAPKVMQQIIPEVHSEAPMMSDPQGGDFTNIRQKVFDREELQDVLFADHKEKPYPRLQTAAKSAGSLGTFFALD